MASSSFPIWPAADDPRASWVAEGTTGSKQECLRHIDEVWTDMRPRSLREEMERHS